VEQTFANVQTEIGILQFRLDLPDLLLKSGEKSAELGQYGPVKLDVPNSIAAGRGEGCEETITVGLPVVIMILSTRVYKAKPLSQLMRTRPLAGLDRIASTARPVQVPIFISKFWIEAQRAMVIDFSRLPTSKKELMPQAIGTAILEISPQKRTIIEIVFEFGDI